MHDIRARVRNMLGARAIAVLPSAASLAPLRAADAAHVQAVRMRTMAITCIAGLAGLPQVSLPLRTAAGEPVGVSLLGPAGSDRTLIELASQLHGDLD
jgi:amidase